MLEHRAYSSKVSGSIPLSRTTRGCIMRKKHQVIAEFDTDEEADIFTILLMTSWRNLLLEKGVMLKTIMVKDKKVN